MGSERRRELYAVGLLTLIAAGLRFSTLGLQSFWYDEAVASTVVMPSLIDTIDQLIDREVHPPGFHAAAWLWTRVFGEGDLGFRSLSALVGTLTVPAAYGAAKELVSRRAGFMVAALAATSPFLIWYSQENRPYEFALFWATLSLYFFARVLRADRRGRDLALWAAASSVAVCSHYFAAFPILVEAVLILRVLGPRRDVLAAFLPIAVLGLVFIPLAVHQAGDAQADWITGTPLWERVTSAAKSFVSGPYGAPGRGLGLLAALLAAAGAALLLMKARESESRGALMAASIGLISLAASVVCALVGLDFFNGRNVIMLWVPAAIVVAAGLAGAGRLGVVIAGALCATLLAIHVGILADDDYQRTNWEKALRVIGEPDERRGLIVSPQFAAVVPIHYGRELSYAGGRPVKLREIAILAEGGRAPFSTGDSWLGFKVTDQRMVHRVQVTRLEAPRPVRVQPRAIPGSVIGARDGGLLIEEPAR